MEDLRTVLKETPLPLDVLKELLGKAPDFCAWHSSVVLLMSSANVSFARPTRPANVTSEDGVSPHSPLLLLGLGKAGR